MKVSKFLLGALRRSCTEMKFKSVSPNSHYFLLDNVEVRVSNHLKGIQNNNTQLSIIRPSGSKQYFIAKPREVFMKAVTLKDLPGVVSEYVTLTSSRSSMLVKENVVQKTTSSSSDFLKRYDNFKSFFDVNRIGTIKSLSKFTSSESYLGTLLSIVSIDLYGRPIKGKSHRRKMIDRLKNFTGNYDAFRDTVYRAALKDSSYNAYNKLLGKRALTKREREKTPQDILRDQYLLKGTCTDFFQYEKCKSMPSIPNNTRTKVITGALKVHGVKPTKENTHMFYCMSGSVSALVGYIKNKINYTDTGKLKKPSQKFLDSVA